MKFETVIWEWRQICHIRESRYDCHLRRERKPSYKEINKRVVIINKDKVVKSRYKDTAFEDVQIKFSIYKDKAII